MIANRNSPIVSLRAGADVGVSKGTDLAGEPLGELRC